MPKVLVLDVGWPQTGFLIASLHRAGFEVVRATPGAPDRWGIGHYCREVSAPAEFPPAFLEQLLMQEPADVVLPLSEEIYANLWTLPPALTARVMPQATAEQRDAFRDRHVMYGLASEVGVPLPPMRDLPSAADLGPAIDALGLPLVLRGTAGLGGLQVRVVRDHAAASAALAELRQTSPGTPFAQRMIRGDRHLVGALLDHGRVVSAYVQRTTESVKPPTGPSIRVEVVDVPRVLAHATRLFARLGWHGLACAEFVQDDDGEYYFMEVNPRPWAAIRAAHAAGVPLIDDFATMLAGRVPPQRQPARRRQVTLFPQYLFSKASGLSTFRWAELPHLLNSFREAPWREPWLMLHYARLFWWI